MGASIDNDTFDYLIIGSGTAGCVLANRLSEEQANTVCMIEAGPPDKNPLIHIPAAVAALINHKTLGWGYKTVPQPGMGGREIPVPRGRVLGGCSSTNGMVYYRGHPKDFDDWAAEGNTGWSFREVLSYFTRSENNEAFRDPPWHGTGGPMGVVNIENANPLNHAFLEATESLQYPRCKDFNGTLAPEGFNLRQANIRNGRRESGVTAFINPVRHRKNLNIMTGVLVTRILLEGKRAIGIEIHVDGTAHKLMARKEVILAAGTFGSPQIMLLSGIGAGEELAALGIAVKHALPAVGRNFQDHVAVGIINRTENTDSYGLSLRAFPRDVWSVFNYLLFRRGVLASNVFESMGFLRTTEGLDRPDVQFVFQPANRPKPGFPVPVGHGYAMNPVLLYPKSRGRVSLASPDPHAAPLIDPRLLSEPEDIEPLYRSILISRRIFQAAAFAPYNSTETLPGPDVQDEEGIKNYIRQYAVTVHHPVSTCRMGTGSDAVVDAELRVHGIDGLRVADASVFPGLIGGNTNAAVVMVAEKAADMILGRPAPPAANLEGDSK
jgi:choline dehydrogenase-like flavoprotein